MQTQAQGLMDRWTTLRRMAWAWCAGAAMILGGSAGVARAQATDIEPVYVVVTQDTELRCDAGAAWYAVGDLKAGQVLRANGVSFDWLRVEYPAGTQAVIKVGEAELRSAEQRVVLTRQTRLRAFNPGAPRIENCYKAVAQDLMAPGLSLRYLGDVKNNRDEVAGYLVAAPAGAHGYVLESATRRASEQEVKAVLGALSGTTTPSTTTASTPQSAPSNVTGAAPINPVNQLLPVDTAVPTAVQAALGATPTDPSAAPTTDAGAGLNTAMPKNVQRSMDMIAELERAYKKVAEESLAQAELQPLIDAYAKLQDEARGSEAELQVKRFAETRIELLKVRRELQKSVADLAAIDAEAQRTTETFTTIDQQLASSAEYEFIGRLVPSAVYAGGQMPLLYRLQSVDGASSRTVAYLAPDPTMSLDGKLGAVVGVRGEQRIEGRGGPVGVPVIEPSVVTVLRPASAAAATPTPAQ